MRNIAIVDETFDINLSSSYHLALQVSEDGLSFAIMDILRKKYIALKNLLFDDTIPLSKEDQVKRFLSRDNHLNRSYKTTGLIYSTPNAVLVPNPLFDPDRIEELYRFSNSLPENNRLMINNILSIDSKMVFAVPNKLIDSLEDHPNKYKIFHQACPEIESASLQARNSQDETFAIAHFHSGFFDMLVFQKGKFMLFNSFSFQTDQDIIFYILYVFEQFELNMAEFKLILSGKVDENSELTEKLLQFIPQLSFARFNKNFTFSYTFGQINEHQFSNLFNLYPCV